MYVTEKDSTQWSFIWRIPKSNQLRPYGTKKLWRSNSNYSKSLHVIMTLDYVLSLRMPSRIIHTRVGFNKTRKHVSRKWLTTGVRAHAGFHPVFPVLFPASFCFQDAICASATRKSEHASSCKNFAGTHLIFAINSQRPNLRALSTWMRLFDTSHRDLPWVAKRTRKFPRKYTQVAKKKNILRQTILYFIG